MTRRAGHPGDAPFTVFIDGACPLCRREAKWLRSMDRGRGLVLLQDIAKPDFDPGRYGLTEGDFLAEIHGMLPDGRIIRGMEVFRRAYAAIGLSWLLAPTGWPIVRPLADRAYSWFARNRQRLTGQGSRNSGERCDGNRCRPRRTRRRPWDRSLNRGAA